MKKYNYRVKDWNGKASKGVVEANSVAEAVESIRAMCHCGSMNTKKGFFQKCNRQYFLAFQKNRLVTLPDSWPL